MNHIMLDIETLGTDPRSVVVAIGAVVFDPYTGEFGESLYRELTNDLQRQVEKGRVMDAGTVVWWMQQSDEARKVFSKKEWPDRVTTVSALSDFALMVKKNGGENVRIWGNGAAFDNVVLSTLYEDMDVIKPWGHRNDRCFRTLKAEFGGDLELSRYGTHHNALDDAMTQARQLVQIMKHLKGKA